MLTTHHIHGRLLIPWLLLLELIRHLLLRNSSSHERIELTWLLLLCGRLLRCAILIDIYGHVHTCEKVRLLWECRLLLHAWLLLETTYRSLLLSWVHSHPHHVVVLLSSETAGTSHHLWLLLIHLRATVITSTVILLLRVRRGECIESRVFVRLLHGHSTPHGRSGGLLIVHVH